MYGKSAAHLCVTDRCLFCPCFLRYGRFFIKCFWVLLFVVPVGLWFWKLIVRWTRLGWTLVWCCIHKGFVLLLSCVLCMFRDEHLNSTRTLNSWVPEIVTECRTLSRRELTRVQFHSEFWDDSQNWSLLPSWVKHRLQTAAFSVF